MKVETTTKTKESSYFMTYIFAVMFSSVIASVIIYLFPRMVDAEQKGNYLRFDTKSDEKLLNRDLSDYQRLD